MKTATEKSKNKFIYLSFLILSFAISSCKKCEKCGIPESPPVQNETGIVNFAWDPNSAQLKCLVEVHVFIDDKEIGLLSKSNTLTSVIATGEHTYRFEASTNCGSNSSDIFKINKGESKTILYL